MDIKEVDGKMWIFHRAERNKIHGVWLIRVKKSSMFLLRVGEFPVLNQNS